MSGEIVSTRSDAAAQASADLAFVRETDPERLLKKLTVAALNGVPVLGAFLAPGVELRGDNKAAAADEAMQMWLNSLESAVGELREHLAYIGDRGEKLGDEALRKMKSEDYLRLVRRVSGWDRAESDEKKWHYSKLLANAAGTPLSEDDLIRLFIEWLDRYHRAHFEMIRFVYQNQPCTRHEIAVGVLGEPLLAENSVGADLFSEVFRELNLGGIIRQARETDSAGNFYKQSAGARRRDRNQATSLDRARQTLRPLRPRRRR